MDLRARAADRSSDARVAIAGRVAEKDATVYDLRFIANIPGSFDLAALLERADGRPIDTLPALIVSVWSSLPEEATLEIEAPAPGAPVLRRGYWWFVGAAAALWALVPVVALVRRAVKRRAVAGPVPTAAPPTLADRLRPLIEAEIAGTGDEKTRARMEMLVLEDAGMARTSATMNPRAGPSSAWSGAGVRTTAATEPAAEALESWLHRPHDAGAEPGDRSRALDALRPLVDPKQPRGGEGAA